MTKEQIENIINSDSFYQELDEVIDNSDPEVGSLTDKIMAFLERQLLRERVELKRLLHPNGHFNLTIQMHEKDDRKYLIGLAVNKFELKETDPKLSFYKLGDEHWLEIEETPNTLKYMTNVCNYINNNG